MRTDVASCGGIEGGQAGGDELGDDLAAEVDVTLDGEPGRPICPLLTELCMNKGYSSRTYPDLTKVAPSTTRIFDLKRVEKYGYRPIVAPEITDAWLAYLTQKFSPDEQTAYDKCDAPGVVRGDDLEISSHNRSAHTCLACIRSEGNPLLTPTDAIQLGVARVRTIRRRG